MPEAAPEPILGSLPALERVETEATGSILDGLRARRDQIAKAKARELMLEIPDGVTGLRCVYPPVGYRAINAAVERAAASSDPDATLNVNADVILACCAEVVGRKEAGPWEPLMDGGAHIGPTLADALGIDVPAEVKSPARHILRHIYSPRAATTGEFDGDLALLAAGDELVGWLRSGQGSTSEQFSDF